MLVFTNNETGETKVKSFSQESSDIKDYQRYYDTVFGKGKYTFWMTTSSRAKEFGCGN